MVLPRVESVAPAVQAGLCRARKVCGSASGAYRGGCRGPFRRSRAAVWCVRHPLATGVHRADACRRPATAWRWQTVQAFLIPRQKNFLPGGRAQCRHGTSKRPAPLFRHARSIIPSPTDGELARSTPRVAGVEFRAEGRRREVCCREITLETASGRIGCVAESFTNARLCFGLPHEWSAVSGRKLKLESTRGFELVPGRPQRQPSPPAVSGPRAIVVIGVIKDQHSRRTDGTPPLLCTTVSPPPLRPTT